MFHALEITKPYRFIAIGLVIVFLLASSGLADDQPRLRSVDNSSVSGEKFQMLINACTTGKYENLAKLYYGDSLFFPDLIRAYAVFVLDPAIDTYPYKGIVLEQKGKDKKHILYGARAVYPWVFMLVPSDTSGNPDSKRLIRNPRDDSLISLPNQVIVRHSQYAQQLDPGIRVFSFLATTIGNISPTGLDDVVKAADKIDMLDFHEIIPVDCIGRPVKNRPSYRLFLARGKVNLERQTINGLSAGLVKPSSSDVADSSKEGSTLADESNKVQWPPSAEWSILYSREASVRFANYRKYPFGLGLGLAFSTKEVNDTTNTEAPFEKLRPNNMDVEPFLLLHCYPISSLRPQWPRLPGRGPAVSLALSAGVKVDFDDFPQDLFFGLSLGDLRIRHLQFSAGINLPVFKVSDRKKRKLEFMWLLSVRLS